MADNERDMYEPRYWRLAHAYVPFQAYTETYPLDEALMKGTLFPALFQPELRNRPY